MDMSFEVKLNQYAGPLQVLLELIEKDELPITEVSLAEVTDDYIRHVNKHQPDSDELADFIVIASRLLLIKSRAILPSVEEEEVPESTLALQLRLYKLFVDASNNLSALHQSDNESFSRLKSDVIKKPNFNFPEGLTVDSLEKSFIILLKRLEPYFSLKRVALERIATVQERMKEIHDSILDRSRLTFKYMITKSRSKVDIVVSFLALLELVKQNIIHTVQSDTFSDIEIKRID